MDISLYLMNYLQARLNSKADFVDVYIADALIGKQMEIIIRDNGEKIDEQNQIPESFLSLSKICTQASGEFKHLFHIKHTSVHMEWNLNDKKKYSLENIHSLLGMMILNFPKTRIVFTYLSKKGEYVFDSQKIIAEFTQKELLQKEVLNYMSQLLEEHLNKVRDNL